MKPNFLQSLALIFLLKLAASPAAAQQLIYNSFYRQNWQLLNPAATDPTFSGKGDNPILLFQGNIRQQWAFSGIEGAPRFGYLSAEYCKPPQNGPDFFKFGLSLVADQTDVLKTTGVFFNTAYFLGGRNRSYFSLGFSPGYVFTALDQAKVRLADPEDALPVVFEKHSAIEIPIGLFYRKSVGSTNEESYFFGLSVPQGLAFNLSDAKALGGGLASYKKLHLNAVFGRTIYLTQGIGQFESFTLEPTVWLRWAKGAKLGGDIGARTVFEDRDDSAHWFGASLGANTQLHLEFGFYRLLNRDRSHGYRLGLAYGAPPFGKYHRLGNSFELSMAFYGK